MNKAKADLVLDPPIKVADPHIKKLAQDAIAAEKALETLDQHQKLERIDALETFEQQREQSKQKMEQGLGDSWLRAVEKASQQEADRSHDRKLSKDFNRSR